MRFEAKHSYFKKLAKVIGNFTNVAQTLSYRHQHWMCYKLLTSNANLGTFIEKGVQVGPGNFYKICLHLLKTMLFFGCAFSVLQKMFIKLAFANYTYIIWLRNFVVGS